MITLTIGCIGSMVESVKIILIQIQPTRKADGKTTKLTGRSRASIYRWVKAGTFPAPYKIGGGGSIAWKRSDYNEWSKSLQKVRY